MSELKDIIRLKSILKKYTSETKDGRIHFGLYPHVGHTGKRMVQMPYQDTLRNWFLPFGVPYTTMSGDNMGLKRKYIAYGIGNELFIHKAMYDKFIGNQTAQILSTPVIDSGTSLMRAGWQDEENKIYQSLLWRLSIRTSGQDFQQISRIDFDNKLNLDKAVLERDGWLANRILGSNAFYGIYTGPTKIQNDTKIYWYNKYIVLVDVNGGTGLMIDGMMKRERNPHPHVHPDLKLCFGGYERMMMDHINKGEMTNFFLLTKHFLGQYNPQSPTFRLPLEKSQKATLSGPASKYFSKFIYFR